MSKITDRVKKVLDVKNLTPSQLADAINVNRSRLSHILTGRNNPSLEIVQSILEEYPEINPDWMISGKGSMLRSDTEQKPLKQNTITSTKQKSQNLDLFSYMNEGEEEKNDSESLQSSESEIEDIDIEKVKSNEVVTEIPSQKVDAPEIILSKEDKARVKMIMLYYDNKHYEIFYPEK